MKFIYKDLTWSSMCAHLQHLKHHLWYHPLLATTFSASKTFPWHCGHAASPALASARMARVSKAPRDLARERAPNLRIERFCVNLT